MIGFGTDLAFLRGCKEGLPQRAEGLPAFAAFEAIPRGITPGEDGDVTILAFASHHA